MVPDSDDVAWLSLWYGRFFFEHDESDEAHAAFLAMDEAVRSEPGVAWQAIQILLDQAETTTQVAALGAGPLEDLLKHNAEFRDVARTAAAENSKLRDAIAMVRFWSFEKT